MAGKEGDQNIRLSFPLPRPVGASERNWSMSGSSKPDILCQLCDTTQKIEGHETVTINQIFGLQVVEECCGAVIDRLFEQHGASFTEAYLEEFAKDPTNPRFGFFRRKLVETLKRAQENIQEVSAVLAESQTIAEAID